MRPPIRALWAEASQIRSGRPAQTCANERTRFRAKGESACRDPMQPIKSGRQRPVACAAAREVLVTVSASGTTEASAGIIGPTGRPLPIFPEPEPLLTHGPARVVAV